MSARGLNWKAGRRERLSSNTGKYLRDAGGAGGQFPVSPFSEQYAVTMRQSVG